MNIITEAKKVHFFWKLLNNDYSDILSYPFVPQKHKDAACDSQPLPQVTPEEAGISEDVLCNFYKELSAVKSLAPHAAVIMKGGKVISQTSWKPFSCDLRHVTYSACKSIVSLAAGIAESEGLFSLSEHIVDIFPEKTPFLASKNIREVTIHHLLTMTSGVRFCEADIMLEEDWIKGFLNSDTKFQPGTKFEYNSLNTYMLSAIIQKKTNMDLLSYLEPRLFTPLGINDVQWEKCPHGIIKGGWGCYLSANELAKLGQLCLNMGRWNVNGTEMQLVPQKWIEDATSEQVKNTGNALSYGYQIWRFTDMDGYMFNGMFGQYVIVLPKQDMVIALNSGCDSFFAKEETLMIIKKFFADAEYTLQNSEKYFDKLKKVESSLEFQKPVVLEPPQVKTWYQKITELFKKKETKKLPEQISMLSGKEYRFEKASGGLLPLMLQVVQGNFSKGMQSISFTMKDGIFYILIKEGTEAYTIPVGFSEYRNSNVTINGEYYEIGTKGTFAADEDDHMVLKITMCFTETASTRFMKVFFMEDDKIIFKMTEYPHVDTLMTDSIKQNERYIPSIIKGTMKSQKEFMDFLIQQTSNPVLHGELVQNLNISESVAFTTTKDKSETKSF